MPTFHFYHTIEVRYGDLDPQGHVNNAKFMTYMEQARVSYIRHLGLWTGGNFFTIGFILADAQITFRKPILFGQPVRIGVRVTRLGNKSLTMDYLVDHAEDGSVFATGSSVLVTYDYTSEQTITIPESWRTTIQQFEKMSPE
jgi:acyl-CoA thioester hydrolase